jgi:hypothetical protein
LRNGKFVAERNRERKVESLKFWEVGRRRRMRRRRITKRKGKIDRYKRQVGKRLFWRRKNKTSNERVPRQMLNFCFVVEKATFFYLLHFLVEISRSRWDLVAHIERGTLHVAFWCLVLFLAFSVFFLFFFIYISI